jgi:hypothetical protein
MAFGHDRLYGGRRLDNLAYLTIVNGRGTVLGHHATSMRRALRCASLWAAQVSGFMMCFWKAARCCRIA